MVESSTPPGSRGFGDAAGGAVTGTPGAPDAKKAKRASVLRWTGTGLMLLGAGFTGLIALSASDMNAAALEPEFKKIEAYDERTATAKDALLGLPDETSSKRAFDATIKDAASVAALQNSFGEKVVPVTKDGNGDPLPAEEVESQAAAEKRVYGTASRNLASYFAMDTSTEASTPLGESVDPSGVWFGGLGDGIATSWAPVVSVGYDEVGGIPAMWQLRDNDGVLLGWVEANYDPSQRKFSEPVLTLSTAGQNVVAGIEESVLEAAREATGTVKPAETSTDKTETKKEATE